MSSLTRSIEKEEFWRLALDEQKHSGLNVRAFCRREGLSEPSFYAWRREIQKRDGKNQSPPSGDPRHQVAKLVPVKVIDAKDDSVVSGETAGAPFEIIAPNGFTLRFDGDAKIEMIDALLDVVGRQESRAMSC